jgi:hypothetical protein
MKSPLLNYDNYIIRMPNRKAQGKPVSLEHPPEGVIWTIYLESPSLEWSPQASHVYPLMDTGKKSLSDS